MTIHLCGAEPYKINKGTNSRLADSRSQDDCWSINKEYHILKTYKSVQTAFSSIDFKSISNKSTLCNSLLRSKSNDYFGNNRKRILLGNERRNRSLLLEEEVSEWFHIYGNKVKLNEWPDKLQRLAQKLGKPGGEEKLRRKIEKYLDRIPSLLSDNDSRELKQQLPDDIIRKLKKLYLKNEEGRYSTPINVFRLELPRSSLHHENYNVKLVTKNSLKNINIKKRDFLGRFVEQDDILNYMVHKLKPLGNISDCESEYMYILETCIMEILEELPIVNDRRDKRKYLKRLTDNLIENLLKIYKRKHKITKNVSVDCQLNISDSGVQHLQTELKEFISAEISNFLEKSCIAINTKQLEQIETELADVLINTIDSGQDDIIKENISIILRNVGDFPEYQAFYFADSLYNDLKDIFCYNNRFNYLCNRYKSHRSLKTFPSYPKKDFIFQNHSLRNRNNTRDFGIRKVTDADKNNNLENYRKQLVYQIDEWLRNTDIPLAQDKTFRLGAVEDLAGDIVNGYKYLELNPNSTKANELKQLKYQIFEWINKLAREDNMETIEHAHELMQRIQNIPVHMHIRPQETTVKGVPTCCQSQVFRGAQTSLPYSLIENLSHEILDWFYELSYDIHLSEDASLNNQVLKDLSKSMNKDLKLNLNPNDAINKEADLWNKNIVLGKFQSSAIEKLKQIIKNVLFRGDVCRLEKDPRKQKASVRRYEDVIDDCIDTTPLRLRDEPLFINVRNECVHELAVKVYNTKTKLVKTSDDIIEKNLQEDILNWIKKLSLHSQADKKSNRDRFTGKLLKNIQECNPLDSDSDLKEKQDHQELVVNQIKGAIIDWLKELPLNQIKALTHKQNQQGTIRDLLSKLNQTIQELSLNISADLDRVSLEGEQKKFVHSIKRLRTSSSNDNDLKVEVNNNKISTDHNKKCIDQFSSRKSEKLLKKLPVLTIDNLSSKMIRKSMDLVHDVIRIWCKSLPLSPRHCPKEVRSLIDQMAVKIIKQIAHPQYTTIEEHQEKIKGEILKHLRGFPLSPDQQSEQNLSKMVTTLWKDIKYINFYRHDGNLNTIQTIIAPQNLTVYGVSLQNDHINVNRNDNTEISLQGITEEDINTNLNTYLNQLTAQINQWLTNLQILEITEKECRDVVVDDLAGDIVDRHKYLELNPSSRGTDEDELEHLKYQIFKWINKLVGEDNMETIEHASDLMQRIQSLPVPMLVKPQDVLENQRNQPSCCQPRIRIAKHKSMFSTAGPGESMTENTIQKATNERYRNPGNKRDQMINVSRGQMLIHIPEPGENKIESSRQRAQKRSSWPSSFHQPTANTNRSKDLSIFGTAGPGRLKEPSCYPTSKRMSSLGELGVSKIPQSIPQCKTLNEAFEFFYNAIREKSEELPLATPTPEQKTLAELAKRGMFNAIVMNFHNMKSDPEIGNDYGQFELILEDRLDLMLDCLPQTADMLKIRQMWKVKVIQLAIDLLKYIHKITDSQSFRRQVERGIKRRVIKANLQQKSDRIMHDFIVKTANDFILYSNYKEEDPLKANIYRQRLMKKLEEFAQYATTSGNVQFRFINRVQLRQEAFKVLQDVPIPNREELKEEADVILLDEEIEQWYNELPVKPISSESDNVLRNRMRELLAKKIHAMEKQIDVGDPSMERLIKHEISNFLHEQGKLEEDQDLNINFMVEELNNRLKCRRQQPRMLGYRTFEQDKPFSSTLVQLDPVEALASLVEVQSDTSRAIPGPSGYQGTQMPREFETNQHGQLYEGMQGSSGQRLAEYLSHHSLGPVHIPDHTSFPELLIAPNLQRSHINGTNDNVFLDNQARPPIQMNGVSSQVAAPCSSCNNVLQEGHIFEANNQTSLAVNQLRPGTQVTETRSQDYGPCSFTNQYTTSDQFLSASPRSLGNPEPMLAQATTSTARICCTSLPVEPELSPERRASGRLEEPEEDEERGGKIERCRCIEKFRRPRWRRCTCYSCSNDNDNDGPRFYLMLLPCRCHY